MQRMLGTRLLRRDFRCYIQLCRSYSCISSEFKSLMDNRPNPLSVGKEQMELIRRKEPSAVEFDVFINKLPPNSEHQSELLDRLLYLRSSEEATNVHESVSHSVIKYFLDIDNVPDLLLLLKRRLEYGVFVDTFTGCYLIDRLLQKEDYAAAVLVAVELMLQNDLENELAAALAIKSCYEYLRKVGLEKPAQAEGIEESESTEPKKKVRVKYLRNIDEKEVQFENDLGHQIGKVLIQSAHTDNAVLNNNVRALGLFLCSEYQAFIEFISAKKITLCADIVKQILPTVIDKDDAPAELSSLVNEMGATTELKTLDELLQNVLTTVTQREEPKLVEQQKQKVLQWQQERENKFKVEMDAQSRAIREKNIETILEETNRKRQELWFFTNREKIDLQILNKKVYYPKRWFGKKKKPRVADDNYVPPEVTKKLA